MKKRKQNGITLIALVITILVLIILSGIAIASLTKKESNINEARKAKEEYKNAEIEENIGISYAQAQEGKYNLNEDLSAKIKENLDKTYGTDNVQVSKKTGNMGYTVTINGKDYDIGENGQATEYTTEIPRNLKIGDYVDYSPTGTTYFWSGKYATDTPINEDGITTNSDETFDSRIGGQDRVTRWRVLDIEDGNVKLVPATAPPTHVYLGRAPGYNNCVYLLNEACRVLYTNQDLGITDENVRSVNLEDFESLVKPEILEQKKEEYNYARRSGTIDENDQLIRPNGPSYSYYPLIYPKEAKSVINGNANLGTWNASQQEYLFERDDSVDELQSDGTTIITKPASSQYSSYPIGMVQATTSIQPYQNAYLFTIPKVNGKPNYEPFEKKKGQLEIFFNQGYSQGFYLATRVIYLGNGHPGSDSLCEFNIEVAQVHSWAVRYEYMWGSYWGGTSVWAGICPIITVNRNRISGNDLTGYRIE